MKRFSDTHFLGLLGISIAFLAPWTASWARLPLQLKVAEAIAIIFLLFLTLRSLLRARIYLPPGTFPMLAVLAMSLVSLLLSPPPAKSGFEWAHGVYQPGLYNLTIVARQGFCFLFYVGVVNICKNMSLVIRLLRAFILGGVFAAVVGLGQAILYFLTKSTTGIYVVPWSIVPRILGTCNEPSPYSNYLAIVAVLLVASLLFNQLVFTEKKTFVFLLIVISAIILTFSFRGLSEIILGTGYLWFSAKGRLKSFTKILAIGCLVVLILTVFYPQGFKGLVWTFSKVHSESQLTRAQSYGGRNSGIYIAPLMFLDKPLYGIGIGNYPFLRNDFAQLAGVPRVFHLDLPNNIYLHFLAETGLIGFILLMCFIARVFFHVIKKRSDFYGTNDGLFRGLKAAVLITLFDLLFSSALYFFHVWLVFGLLVGCVRRGHASRLNQMV